MQTSTFYLNKAFLEDVGIDTAFSFSPFIALLEEKISVENTVKERYYQFIIDLFKKDPALLSAGLKLSGIKDIKEIFELIYSALTPLIADEDSYLWALCTPVPTTVFYCTDAFAAFAANKLSAGNPSLVTEHNIQKEQYIYFVYRLLLNRLYNFTAELNNEIHLNVLNSDTGLYKYYSIHVDTSYIEINVKGTLPELHFDDIEPYLHEDKNIDALTAILPLTLFELKGFSIVTLKDVTPQHAIDEIRNALINHHSDEKELYQQVLSSLKTLSGNNIIRFGLMPFTKLNGQTVFDNHKCSNSIIIRSARRYDVAESTFISMVKQYEDNPKAVYLPSVEKAKGEDDVFLGILSQAGIRSYACVPVYNNKHLTGILEIYAYSEITFSENLLSTLDFALPLLAQLFQNSIDNFDLTIDQAIKENFTSLQSSVLWKFNAAAWNYIKHQRANNSRAKMETVEFKNVYPFYGAIDIRNSTIERNAAARLDLTHILTGVMSTLNQLKAHNNSDKLNDIYSKSNEWLKRIGGDLDPDTEVEITRFFENEVNAFLIQAKNDLPQLTDIIDMSLELMDTSCDSGGHIYQQQLEASIQIINTTINTYLENAQKQLQALYPCYFEKFRTDGVEYDIYAGQSIAPQKPFTPSTLTAVRMWQIRSMAEIVVLTYGIKHKMPDALQTTQLIFIHSNPIDISFRNDEKRFDVEGVYNIRYEVIKRRIDKAVLKGSKERLTQPGKIAMVYFTQTELEEYEKYIAQLQTEQVLLNGTEYIELEELQGVNGLKAIRVKINLPG